MIYYVDSVCIRFVSSEPFLSTYISYSNLDYAKENFEYFKEHPPFFAPKPSTMCLETGIAEIDYFGERTCYNTIKTHDKYLLK